MNLHINKKQWPIFALLSMLFAFLLYLMFKSEGYYGGGDNMTHYRYSRYAFELPKYLIYHWGKPFYTLLSAPFAQFGFNGVRFFNVLISILSGWVAYLIGKHFNYKNALLLPVLLVFIPVYLAITLSALTEILFGFVSLLAFYYFLKKHYYIAAIVLSFSVFVRTEGIFFLPIMGLALLVKKQYKALPFLLFGFILYSIVGSFYYNDLLWVINRNPYDGYKVYGTGPLLHFFIHSPGYFGTPVVVLLVIGLVSYLIELKNNFKDHFIEFSFIAGPFLLFFLGHSFMWWSGHGNSLGLARYMAGIGPFAALIVLKGVNTIFILLNRIIKTKIVTISILSFILLAYVYTPFTIYRFPVPLLPHQKVVKECSIWLKENGYTNQKIFYYDPDFPHFLDLYPFDSDEARCTIYNREKPETKIENGQIILWDTHFALGGNLQYDSLIVNPNFKLVKEFHPKYNFQFYKQDYKVAVFEKVPLLSE